MALITILCYNQEDKHMARKLKKHLSSLENNEKIRLWDFGNIIPGSETEQEVDKYLNEAQIILLLISADFLASEYYCKVVMQQAVTRHECKDARVIPVIMRKVHWQESPLDKLQPLPEDAKPITKWRPQDEGFANVVEGLIRVIDQWETHSLAEPIVERKIFMEKLDQLIEAVKTHMQPPPRAMATANTLKQLSIFTPNETTFADLIVGWQILAHSSEQEEDIATSRRRITCGELANIASQFTTNQGNLDQAIKTWNRWQETFKGSDDPRQAAMANTFARELAELQRAIH